MTLPPRRVLQLILFTSFALCVCQVPSFSVTGDQCVAPTLDYNAPTIRGLEGVVHIYTMSPFTSCSGRVVGYWFCYQNTSSTIGGRVNTSTVLLLEDMGANYQVVAELNVEAEPGEDNCLSGSPPGGQCCVTQNLAAESQFGVNSSYLYGVVDLPDGPNMIWTHVSVGRPGYVYASAEYTQSGGTLRKSGNPTLHPLKMFQFIIYNSNSTTSTAPTSAAPLTNIPSTSDTPSTTDTLSTDTLSPPTGETFSSPTTSDTDETSSNLPPTSSLSTQQSTDVQTSLPVSTIIIISTVIPSTLVLLMLVCNVLLIILIVRRRITRKQEDATHGHIDSTELNTFAPHKTALVHFEMNTNDAYGTNTAEIATTGNVAYTTIPATQNVAYRQVPPGTDDCYDYVI